MERDDAGLLLLVDCLGPDVGEDLLRFFAEVLRGVVAGVDECREHLETEVVAGGHWSTAETALIAAEAARKQLAQTVTLSSLENVTPHV